MTTKSDFPYCHENIARVLACPICSVEESKSQRFHIDSETLDITDTMPDKPVTLDCLVELAHVSHAVFPQHILESTMSNSTAVSQEQSLWSISHTAVATILALNALESAICRSTGFSRGRAPLVKNMLEQLTESHIQAILQRLLLPKEGLNLRNLMWHGFVEDLPRPWLALVLVLLANLTTDEQEMERNEPATPVFDVPQYPLLYRLVQEPLPSDWSERLYSWLPHPSLLTWTLQEYHAQRHPARIVAIFSILLEHGLRLQWCRWNQLPDEMLARPNFYFATLDGHGQRHVHYLLLHPYIIRESDPTTTALVENRLISTRLSGSITALLTDLYCSPGGPNLRAALAHGTWDGWLYGGTPEDEAKLWRVVQLVLRVMVQVSGDETLQGYKPHFSYTATVVRDLQAVLHGLEALSTEAHIAHACVLNVVSMEQLRDQTMSLPLWRLYHQDSAWTYQDVLEEYAINIRLAKSGIARALLHDVTQAAGSFKLGWDQALLELERPDLTSRQRNKALRICHLTRDAWSLYSFATWLVLQAFMEHVDENSIRRTRMCVSAFATFVLVHADRALRVLNDFCQSKAVLKIVGER